jgi:hypothetical protein
MKVSLIVGGLFLAIAVSNAPALVAEANAQADPHTPNGAALHCPGGMGNVALIPYCDGLRYPDGSFWHQTAASPFGFGGPASLPWNAPVLVSS